MLLIAVEMHSTAISNTFEFKEQYVVRVRSWVLVLSSYSSLA